MQMSARNSWRDGFGDTDLQIAHPSFLANLIWMLILTLAAIGVTFALSCLTPFAALAVALAGTFGLRTSLRTMVVVWFANQAIGFGFLHFPLTANAFLWGAVIGGATVVTTIVASVVMKYGSFWAAPLRLGVALLASFGFYEMTLLGAALFLGGLETFRPAIVAQLALVNAISLVGMVGLNELAAALCRPWLGRIPRLVRA
jgi:hypothetical protein